MVKPPQLSPMAAAMQWVSRIVAAGLMMVLPGLAGQWLDERFETGFLALVGFGLGIWLAIAYLIAITKPKAKKADGHETNNHKSKDDWVEDGPD